MYAWSSYQAFYKSAVIYRQSSQWTVSHDQVSSGSVTETLPPVKEHLHFRSLITPTQRGPYTEFSTYVSMRQHTSAYVSIRQLRSFTAYTCCCAASAPGRAPASDAVAPAFAPDPTLRIAWFEVKAVRNCAGVEQVGAAVQVGSHLILVLVSSEAGWVPPPPQRGEGYRLSAFGRSPVFFF